jgi:hypothetical protein
MNDLERELEQMLHRVLDPIAGRPIPPRRTVPGRGGFRTVMGGAGAALTVKLLTGVAAAAAAVTVAGAVTTGSLNPVVWGQQVSNQVATCKSQLAAGQHGIGGCVSNFASQHGAAVASAARQHGQGSGKDQGSGNSGAHGSGNGNGNGNGNGHKPTTPPGQPTSEPKVDRGGGHTPQPHS